MISNRTNRRTFVKLVGGAIATAGASLPLLRAFASAPPGDGEFFILIHAAGGWDVTLWADPRNERKGLVDPASTENSDTGAIRRWVDAPLDGDAKTFALVRPAGSNITFGPAIGDLADLYDRLTLFNGVAMNTVSHPDGTTFAVTGRHLAGGRAVASSVDTLLANEFGTSQLFPVVSVKYPSSILGSLDPRAVPLRIDRIDDVGKSLARSAVYDTKSDRDAVTLLLSEEARDLAKASYFPETMAGMGLQLDSLRRVLDQSLERLFSETELAAAHPELVPRGGNGRPALKFQAASAINAAFAVEAMKRNLVRCVSFSFGGFDTHNGNYQFQAATQQESFDIVAALVRALDATPHPTKAGEKLADHTHILVVSDFCRTPQINLAGGRDHYPNGSALVISPRFKANVVYGKTDPEQLLPADAGAFTGGPRPVAPPDILATFLGAAGVDPRKYMRDGEVIAEVLR